MNLLDIPDIVNFKYGITGLKYREDKCEGFIDNIKALNTLIIDYEKYFNIKADVYREGLEKKYFIMIY